MAVAEVTQTALVRKTTCTPVERDVLHIVHMGHAADVCDMLRIRRACPPHPTGAQAPFATKGQIFRAVSTLWIDSFRPWT
jgi:hypothetical protein